MKFLINCFNIVLKLLSFSDTALDELLEKVTLIFFAI